MSVNHNIIYVPLTKDLNGNHLIYPIYVPINVDEPEEFIATGKLSKHDYKKTLKLLHSRPVFKMDAKGCGSVHEAGFPFAPLIAALAPIVIPGAIKAAKNVINRIKNRNQSKGYDANGRLYMGRGEEESDEVEEKSVDDYVEDYDNNSVDDYVEEYDSDVDTYDTKKEVSEEEDYKSSAAVENKPSGYIPTNPNITNLKKLQHLYESHV